MDRDELLKRVRRAEEDEGKIYIEEKGYKWGFKFMKAIIAVVLIVNILSDKKVDYSIFAILFAGYTGTVCASYWYGRSKLSLFGGIFWMGVLIYMLYSYVTSL
ncbi:MAG: DUF6442 family protein [Peptostreptococcus sp.]|uniref:DUF6442 family protein n=1 Tax=Peptostreptococcus sp. TaxID=1262 RepID=UPI00290B181D|nr:DUF6442 family protein [Peptostreptococcus sp.]MDU5349532.1 DUF6442 family protein [Peptostreptococcus sp.]MDU5890464.1 DUF6442 family protein [Peptostreptococcus sp.]